jgi:hypothetical protein
MLDVHPAHHNAGNPPGKTTSLNNLHAFETACRQE